MSLNPEKFSQAWQVRLDSATGSFNVPATGAGRVFISNKPNSAIGILTTVNLSTGATEWTKTIAGAFTGGGFLHSIHSPAYAKGMVYVSTGGHTDAALWGFDVATGTQKFRAPISAQWETYYSPTPFGDSLYMNGGSYGGAYSFNARTGTQNWFASLPQYDEWTPAVDENYVYTYTTKLDVLDRKTGALAYSIADTGFDWRGYSVGCAPVLGGMSDIIVTQYNRLIAFDLNTRSVKWQTPISVNYSEMNQPSVADGRVYYANGGYLSVFNQADGSLLSTVPLQGTAESTVILTKTVGFISTSGGTYAFKRKNPTKTVWSTPAHGQLALSKEGMLVIVGADGTVTGIKTRE